MARLETVIRAMKIGSVLSHVRDFSTLGRARSGRRVSRGPVRASGGGTRGLTICDGDGEVVDAVELCLIRVTMERGVER